jgi:hypothetical protein
MISAIVVRLADRRYDQYSVHKSREILINGDYVNYIRRKCKIVNMNLVYKSGDNDMIRAISDLHFKWFDGRDENELMIAYKYGNKDRIDYLESLEPDEIRWNIIGMKDWMDVGVYACYSGSLDLVKRAINMMGISVDEYDWDPAYAVCYRLGWTHIIEYIEKIVAENDNWNIEHVKDQFITSRIDAIIQSGDYERFKREFSRDDLFNRFRRFRDALEYDTMYFNIGVSGNIAMYEDICAVFNYREHKFTHDMTCALYSKNCVAFIEHYDIHLDYQLVNEFEDLLNNSIKSGNLDLVKRAFRETKDDSLLKHVDYSGLICDASEKGYDGIVIWLSEMKERYE